MFLLRDGSHHDPDGLPKGPLSPRTKYRGQLATKKGKAHEERVFPGGPHGRERFPGMSVALYEKV
jgi:hypothetical protein